MKHFLFSFIIILFINCSSNNDKIHVKLEKVCTFGKSEGVEDEILGIIRDYCFDTDGNVYVLDAAFQKIKIFNSNGNFLKTIGFGEGKGPGEFLNPMSIDVDSIGNVYVADQDRRDITIFNNHGVVLKNVKTSFWPNLLIVTKPLEIFILGVPFTFKGGLIKKINFNNLNNEIEVFDFCERINGPDSLAIIWSGNLGSLVETKKGNILYSFPYPYEIREFTTSGELLNTYKRKISFFKPPVFENKSYVNMSTGVSDIIQLTDEIFICNYYKKNRGKYSQYIKYYYDFWNFDLNEVQYTSNNEDLGFNRIGRIKSDKEGNLYFKADAPYPHLIKYKVGIKQVTSVTK